MTNSFLPLPEVRPLNRLNVYDSLIINADRWLRAQTYHRDRQNLHYQSLNHPGIVCGLGVRVIEPPSEAPARFRDRRWLEVQPGIAIDLNGNPVIVTGEVNRKIRIASDAPQRGAITVYLVVSYVEPDHLGHPQDAEELREWFRFEEKTTPPDELELELCRIQLEPGEVCLTLPQDPLQPRTSQTDLRYRVLIQSRPQAVVRVAQIAGKNQGTIQPCYQNFFALSRASAALYPSLQSVVEPNPVRQMAGITLPYDLLYLNGQQINQLQEPDWLGLRNFLKIGGVILVETALEGETLESLKQSFTQQFQVHFVAWEDSDKESGDPAVELLQLVQTQPFLFALPPTLQQQPIQVWLGGGVVLVVGELSSAWGGRTQSAALPRHEICAAQEFGINLLYFAWRRRYLSQLSG